MIWNCFALSSSHQVLLLSSSCALSLRNSLDDLQAIITLLTKQLQRYDESASSKRTPSKHRNSIQAIKTIGFCASVGMQYHIRGSVTLQNWRKLCNG